MDITRRFGRRIAGSNPARSAKLNSSYSVGRVIEVTDNLFAVAHKFLRILQIRYTFRTESAQGLAK